PEDIKSAKVKLIDKNGENLYDALYNFKIENNVYPLVVNDVFAKKHKLGIDDQIDFVISNRVDRYRQKLLEKIYANNPIKQADLKKQYDQNIKT
ncbi:hypothetical protein G3563_28370, partial [Escherichia coli]|nr:hypothetical protein [Escherichia coli]